MPSCIRLLLLSGLIAQTGIAAASSSCGQGESAWRFGQYAQSVKLLSDCLGQPGLDKGQRRQALQMRASAYFNLEQNQAAVRDQEASFTVEAPRTPGEFVNYALYLRRVARYEDSLAQLRAAEKLDAAGGGPTMMTQYHLGWTLAELGRHDEAVKAFGVAIPLQPEFPFVYLKRAQAFEVLGRKEEARADIERAAALVKYSPMALPDDRSMATLRQKVRQYGLGKKYDF
ncbi:hypothetical protein LXA47_27660 [Massilia sp. P8910]|uniref:tetratricopeptide repeat protein n=1 Tax=Massilia antarctica TaxID=2765360 RepID=UPI001E367E6F|nr:tetratricopeptide repeat protein [Massilia antarctica]MCE3607348.1 hypothetical protein [Massilia antarctica]